jgi:hypothetical protein
VHTVHSLSESLFRILAVARWPRYGFGVPVSYSADIRIVRMIRLLNRDGKIVLLVVLISIR